MKSVQIIRSFSLLFLIAPASTEIYTLSLHDALPISSRAAVDHQRREHHHPGGHQQPEGDVVHPREGDRKSTRLNSSHVSISYAVFCLKTKITLISLGQSFANRACEA